MAQQNNNSPFNNFARGSHEIGYHTMPINEFKRETPIINNNMQGGGDRIDPTTNFPNFPGAPGRGHGGTRGSRGIIRAITPFPNGNRGRSRYGYFHHHPQPFRYSPRGHGRRGAFFGPYTVTPAGVVPPNSPNNAAPEYVNNRMMDSSSRSFVTKAEIDALKNQLYLEQEKLSVQLQLIHQNHVDDTEMLRKQLIDLEIDNECLRKDLEVKEKTAEEELRSQQQTIQRKLEEMQAAYYQRLAFNEARNNSKLRFNPYLEDYVQSSEMEPSEAE